MRSRSLTASFAGFGRRACRSAFRWAVEARYCSFPPRVAALRRSSLEMVDADRPNRRPISRTPASCARINAMSSRSANDKYRPDTVRLICGIPPLSRNHRVPTMGDTPQSTAASSLVRPFATLAQNNR